jgi:hypothetical protein
MKGLREKKEEEKKERRRDASIDGRLECGQGGC